MRLNLGCGQGISDEFVNVDIVPLPGVDIVADLDEKWPWEDGTVEYVLASHVFEHVERPDHFMAEAFRVLEDGGVLDIRVPYWKHSNSFTDPTHKRHCTERTFDYWIPGTSLHTQLGAGHGSPPVVFAGLEMKLSKYPGDVIPNELQVKLGKVGDGVPDEPSEPA